MLKFMQSLRFFTFFLIIGLFLGGCSTINSQISGRTATEQYLVTASIERAMNKVEWSRLRGQKVFLEIIGLQPTEFPYMETVIKQQLVKEGAFPVTEVTDADIAITANVKSVGTDIWSSNFGIPILFANNVTTSYNLSGISLYTSNLQEGYCRVEIFAADPDTLKPIWHSPPVNGKSMFRTQTFLGFIGPIKTSDIYPEKKLHRPDDYEASGNGNN
ncbi:MAG: hypothetical protein KC940_09625 [Candidatus Omnitrophica bacterium]|nr:hypothetical protein [Candidatus Omnitrophota bacterium]